MDYGLFDESSKDCDVFPDLKWDIDVNTKITEATATARFYVKCVSIENSLAMKFTTRHDLH